MQNTNGVRNKPVYNNEGQEIFEVYIHNVDFEVTANDVVNQFRHCGPIDHWKFPRKDATR
jgi:RNA recognition motif-containing protein